MPYVQSWPRSLLVRCLFVVGLPLLWVSVGLEATVVAEDVVELSSGAKLRGRVIGRDAKEVTIEVTISNRTFTRKYPLDRVAAITVNGKRQVIGGGTGGPASSASTPTPKTPVKGSGDSPAGSVSPGGVAGVSGGASDTRSEAEVKALIDQLGRTPPDWYDATALNFPNSLDLSWPAKPAGNWNNQKNVGQYIWDIINPNPGRWREGVRLMHHLLTVNKNNADAQGRAMNALGKMYHSLLEDYARAAFWWQMTGLDKNPNAGQNTAHLAECYWKLGNKQMAVDLLNRAPLSYAGIKLWADMGETDKALQLCEAAARGSNPEIASLTAGDACRLAGRFREALAYYNKCLATPATGQQAARIQRVHNRAKSSAEAIQYFELLDLNRVPDGAYQAGSLGYEGQVAVEVTVRSNRITGVRVTQHKEKQFYSSISDTTRKIVEKQGVKGVDATSGATITSEAIINATAKALSAAQKK